MADDGEKDRNEEQDSDRPATASARRDKRRDSARSSAKPAGKGKQSSGKQASGKGTQSRKPEAKPSGAGGDDDDRKGRVTAKRDEKGKRPSLFARISRFLREVVGELRKVIWPTKKQMITYTIVVLIFVAFMVSLVAGLDLALSKGVLWVFG